MRKAKLSVAAAALLAGASLLAACDRSPQTADGTTTKGDPGTAASTPDGTLANTGSPEQGGAAGTGGTVAAASGISAKAADDPAAVGYSGDPLTGKPTPGTAGTPATGGGSATPTNPH
jgi:hypothetical protein